MVKRHTSWLFVTMKVAMDVFLISVSFNLAWWLRYHLWLGGAVSPANYVSLASYGTLRSSLVCSILVILAVVGCYRSQRGRSFTVESVQLAQAILAAFGLLVITLFVLRGTVSSRLLLGFAAVAMLVLLLAVRGLARVVKRIFWRRGIGVIRVLVVGDGLAARDVMRDLLLQQGN